MKVSTHFNVFNFKPFVNSYSFAFIMNSNSKQARYRLSLVPCPAALHYFKWNKSVRHSLTSFFIALIFLLIMVAEVSAEIVGGETEDISDAEVVNE